MKQVSISNSVLNQVAQATIGFVGADLCDLCRQVLLSQNTLGAELFFTFEDFEKVLKKFKASGLKDLLTKVSILSVKKYSFS
jgi:hypothetical protein